MPRWPDKQGRVTNKEIIENRWFYWNNRRGAKRDRNQTLFDRAVEMYKDRPCIYILETNGMVIYVGLSKKGPDRAFMIHDRKFVHSEIEDITIIFPKIIMMPELNVLENTLIRVLKPIANGTYPGSVTKRIWNNVEDPTYLTE